MNNLGGITYGDGKTVVFFQRSEHAPLKATVVVRSTSQWFSWSGSPQDKPNVKLAKEIATMVRG